MITIIFYHQNKVEVLVYTSGNWSSDWYSLARVTKRVDGRDTFSLMLLDIKAYTQSLDQCLPIEI